MPGSHKSELPLPSSLSLMEKHEHAVTEIAAKAGDVVIFTQVVQNAKNDRENSSFRSNFGLFWGENY